MPRPTTKERKPPAGKAGPVPSSKPKSSPKGMKTYTVGATVVAPTGALRGVDPFTPLVVTDIDAHGNLTIAQLGGGKVWRNVPPTAELERIHI